MCNWKQAPTAEVETWLSEDGSGSYAQVALIDPIVGWSGLVRIWVNELTEVMYHRVEFYDRREDAQAWCEQYLGGRTDVQFFPTIAPTPRPQLLVLAPLPDEVMA